jgi:excisionase family DNA binding protein
MRHYQKGNTIGGMKKDIELINHINSEHNPSERSVCTTREAARMLGVSLRTVQLWVENGSLLAWKTDGGHRRISLASITKKLDLRALKIKENVRSATLSVLVVEDDSMLTKLYQATISKWGIPVSMRCSKDGFDALMMIGSEKPDIIITDISMPGMDGIAMLRKLRQNPANNDIEIVVVTGLDTRRIEEMGGVPDNCTVFIKPVPFALLQAKFQALANLKSSTTKQ